MLFNSFSYLVFFPTVVIAYFLIPHHLRWLLLLLASCFFYMFFKPVYILILATTIVIDYYAGILIASTDLKHKKKIFLLISIITNIAILSFFKYFNFINVNLTNFISLIGFKVQIPILTILLPIGLSFHTFQAMSYTIEVYRGKQQPERHFGIYALYVMFFPQLVAGPIERPQNLIHQFHNKKAFDFNQLISGTKLIAWGLFKKLVIADRLSPIVDQVYDHPHGYHGVTIALATLLFAEQIYCDFSGYSDIAIGSARVLGYDLMTNFRNPYMAKSISEFWTRWHISLSTWFRDYLYIPLGGNRVLMPRWMLNILITFIISGLWHGANWTFIVWGLLNGIFILLELMANKMVGPRIQLPSFLKHITTILLISFTWLFFRAANTEYATILLKNMFSLRPSLPINHLNLIVVAALILFFEIAQYLEEKINLFKRIGNLPLVYRMLFYAVFISIILNFGIFNNSQFIYFQF